MKTRTFTQKDPRQASLDSDTYRVAIHARARLSERRTNWVVAAILACGMAACGGDETPSNNASNNSPTNNTSHQTVPNNPESNPPNNPECEPTASGIEICDGIDNDCDGITDEGYDGLGESCTVGEGVCEVSGINVCGIDKISVGCNAEMSAECLAQCEPECLGETPVCDTTDSTCVECLQDSDCTDGVCHPETKSCAACLEDDDCGELYCVPGASVAENRCGACLSNAHCTSQLASVCDASNACVQCSENLDCQHQNRRFCATSNNVQTFCIDCYPEREDEDCNGTVCRTVPENDGDFEKLYECTSIPIGSVGPLQKCTSATACIDDAACVELSYAGNPHGAYCMTKPTGSTCPRPSPILAMRQTPYFQDSVNVCLINETNTTPEAVNDLGKPCLLVSAATDCPAPGSECLPNLQGEFVCSYVCNTDLECPEGVSCGSPDGGVSYCLGTS